MCLFVTQIGRYLLIRNFSCVFKLAIAFAMGIGISFLQSSSYVTVLCRYFNTSVSIPSVEIFVVLFPSIIVLSYQYLAFSVANDYLKSNYGVSVERKFTIWMDNVVAQTWWTRTQSVVDDPTVRGGQSFGVARQSFSSSLCCSFSSR